MGNRQSAGAFFPTLSRIPFGEKSVFLLPTAYSQGNLVASGKPFKALGASLHAKRDEPSLRAMAAQRRSSKTGSGEACTLSPSPHLSEGPALSAGDTLERRGTTNGKAPGLVLPTLLESSKGTTKQWEFYH